MGDEFLQGAVFVFHVLDFLAVDSDLLHFPKDVDVVAIEVFLVVIAGVKNLGTLELGDTQLVPPGCLVIWKLDELGLRESEVLFESILSGIRVLSPLQLFLADASFLKVLLEHRLDCFEGRLVPLSRLSVHRDSLVVEDANFDLLESIVASQGQIQRVGPFLDTLQVWLRVEVHILHILHYSAGLAIVRELEEGPPCQIEC